MGYLWDEELHAYFLFGWFDILVFEPQLLISSPGVIHSSRIELFEGQPFVVIGGVPFPLGQPFPTSAILSYGFDCLDDILRGTLHYFGIGGWSLL